jgi:hypothetical protein
VAQGQEVLRRIGHHLPYRGKTPLENLLTSVCPEIAGSVRQEAVCERQYPPLACREYAELPCAAQAAARR